MIFHNNHSHLHKELQSHRKEKNQQSKIKKEIRKEHWKSLPLKTRLHRRMSQWGINSVHHTNFTAGFCIFLGLQWLALEQFIGLAVNSTTQALYDNKIIGNVSTSETELSAFIVDEIIPILILVWIANNLRHRGTFIFSAFSISALAFKFAIGGLIKRLQGLHIIHLSTLTGIFVEVGAVIILSAIVTIIGLHYHTHIKWFKTWSIQKYQWWNPIKKWFKYIIMDILNHKKLIVVATFVVVLAQIIALPLLSLIAGPDLTPPTSTGSDNGGWMIIPMSIFVAPIFEEFMFRCIWTKGLDGVFKLIDKKKFNTIKYWCAAVLSAILFATFHNTAGSNTGVLLARVIFALILQYLYHRSHSLTIPIAVHSFNNFITYAFAIIGLYL